MFALASVCFPRLLEQRICISYGPVVGHVEAKILWACVLVECIVSLSGIILGSERKLVVVAGRLEVTKNPTTEVRVDKD